MHILIVDDEPLARHELAYLVKEHPKVSKIAEADSIEEAMEKMLQSSIDLVFLDIHLTEESGLTLADKLKKFAHAPQIIFATAYDEYAIKAFEMGAVDYILKPFEKERVHQAIERATRRISPEQPLPEGNPESRSTVVIAQEESIFIVKTEDIHCLSVDQGETTISTGETSYINHEPLTAWEKKLPEDRFLRVHRSYILNLQKIHEIQPWFNQTFQVTMKNGDKVPVSRSYVKVFRERIGF